MDHQFTLSIVGETSWTDEQREWLQFHSLGYSHELTEIGDAYAYLIANRMYDMRTLMDDLSVSFPDETFFAQGDEDDNQLWRVYAKAGKSCIIHGAVTYAEFNPRMLR